MPIDSRIALGGQPIQLADPLETYGKAANLRNILARGRTEQQEQELNAEQIKRAQLQNQATERANATENDFEGIRLEVGGNPDKAIELFEQRGGNRAYATKLREDRAKMVKAIADAKTSEDQAIKAKAEAFTFKTNLFANDLATVVKETDPAVVSQWVQRKLGTYVQGGIMTPEEGQQYAAEFQQKGPSVVREWYANAAGMKHLDDVAESERKIATEQRAVAEEQRKQAESNAKLSGQYMEQAGVMPEKPRELIPGRDIPYPADVEAQRIKMNAQRAERNGLSPGQDQRIQRLATDLDRKPEVKNFQESANKYQTVKAILDKPQIGGPGDLAVVFEFMKGLDPTSVVRESEYATAAKSGNIFSGALAKFNGYLKPEGGFLPPQVKTAFQQILKEKLNVSKRQVRQLYDDYGRRINKISGQQDGLEYLTDYTKILEDEPSGAAGDLGAMSNDELFEFATGKKK